MDLSIVIASFNTKDLLVSCLNSIKKYTKGISYEIIVVDNASVDDSVSAVRELRAKLIENKKNLGFAAANNQGSKAASGEFLLFLNTDTLIEDNVLGEMVTRMRKSPKVGVSTCSLKNKDGSFQATGGFFPSLIRVFSWMTIQDFPFVDSFIKPFHPFHSKSFFNKGESFYKMPRQLDWVTGAFLLTRRGIIKKAGGWDEKYFMYVEEVDLCYKIKKLGYEVWYWPFKSIIHLGGASSKASKFSLLAEYSGIKRFYKKFYPRWQYPIVRALLKIGALGRIVLFGILEGRESAKTYAEAFKLA